MSVDTLIKEWIYMEGTIYCGGNRWVKIADILP